MNQDQTSMPETDLQKPKKPRRKIILWIAIILLSIGAICFVVGYFVWFRVPLSAPLALDLNQPKPTLPDESDIPKDGEIQPTASSPKSPLQLTPTIPQNVPVFIPPTPEAAKQPVCGKDAEWLVLLVGVDYQGDGYLYGLADVIRVARVDFVNMQVNIVPLSRDLIVDIPAGRLTVEGPIKVNQAYLFGTAGMGHYVGSGYGAGSLAEVIQLNFGLTVDHYAVVNFDTFMRFIDAIGGIEVDLPYMVSDPNLGDFHSGIQWLSGERALALARIRRNYSDSFRISNQSIVIKAVLKKLATPAMILKVPGLLIRFKDAFLTDISIQQLTSLGLCFLNNFDMENMQIFAVPNDLIRSDRAYIPTLNNDSFVYRWDLQFVEWLHQSLLAE